MTTRAAAPHRCASTIAFALCALAAAGCDVVVREPSDEARGRAAPPPPAVEPAPVVPPEPVEPSAEPVPPPGTFSAIEARGGVTCALRNDGAIRCWTPARADVPAAQGSFVAMGTGDAIVCGVRADGAIVCPQERVAGFDLPLTLAEIPPDGPFSQVAGGRGFLCGLRQDGRISCRARAGSRAPEPPAGTFRQVVAGDSFVCGLRVDGSVTCADVFGPPRSLRGGAFAQLVASETDLCGVTAQGALRCSAPLRDGPPASRRVRAVGLTSLTSCAVLDDGSVACWGGAEAAALARPGPFRAVAPDASSACALRESGGVECWEAAPAAATPSPASLPLALEIVDVLVNADRRQPDVRGIGISIEPRVTSGGPDDAVSYRVRLYDAKGQPIRATVQNIFTSDRGFVRPEPVGFGGGELFVPYYLIDLPAGEQQIKVAVEGAERTRRDPSAPPPPPVELSGVLERTATITKPPFRMVHLAVASVSVEPGGYDASLFRARKSMPDLMWEVRFGPRHLGRVYTSSVRDDTFAATWDRGPAPFPFSQGDVMSLAVLDHDVARDDVIGELSFTEAQLVAQAQANLPLARSKVTQLVLGLLEVR